MHDGIVRTLTDVRHVQELKNDLISLRTLNSNECTYKAGGGVLRISNERKLMVFIHCRVAWL